MAYDVVTGTAPSYWACYFINGDRGDMTDAELDAADRFHDWLGGSIVSCDDYGFSWGHDAWQFWPYGADCQLYTALVEE